MQWLKFKDMGVASTPPTPPPLWLDMIAEMA